MGQLPTPDPDRRRRPWRRIAGSSGVLLGLIVGAAILIRSTQPRPTTNIIFILIDTLRADRVGAYGGESGAQTPRMDRLAQESIVYERAYAPSSWTTPSLASLFLGQRPFEHRVQQFLVPLPAGSTALAEALKTAGYSTGAFSANTSVSAIGGFARGFDEFASINPAEDRVYGLFAHADATTVNRHVLGWVDGKRDRTRPMFLFVQYMEPHAPYHAHEGVTPARHPALALTDEQLSLAPLLGPWRPEAAARAELWRLSIGQMMRLRSLYDGEVSWVDARLGDLLDQLEQRGLLRDSIVVVTSDHGEELGEHGLYGHGLSLFENEVRVPLIVRLPEGRRRGRVARSIETVGLGAALLRELGLGVPGSFTQPALELAPDPAPAAPGKAPAHDSRPAVSELEPIIKYSMGLHRHSLAVIERKLLQDTTGSLQVVDLKTDPQELKPRPPGPDDQGLIQALDRLLAEEGQPAAIATPITIDEESRRRLEALGYLVGGEPTIPSAGASPVPAATPPS